MAVYWGIVLFFFVLFHLLASRHDSEDKVYAELADQTLVTEATEVIIDTETNDCETKQQDSNGVEILEHTVAQVIMTVDGSNTARRFNGDVLHD